MIRTIFMGTPDFAVPILETLIKNTEVVLVVTKPDTYVGRHQVMSSSPIKKMALEHNIDVFQPLKIKEDYETIKEYKPDLIVTCAYGQIIPEAVLNIPRLGCINVHASLLPKYRGGAPIQWALINGEEETGITIMYMDKGMDTGDIIKMKSIPINTKDTSESLHDKLSVLGSSLLEEVLPSIIAGTNERTRQDNSKATLAPIIKREDEHLNFLDTAQNIDLKVRALYSWPLAYFLLDNTEYKVLEGFVGEETKEEAGVIVKIDKDKIGIACLDKIYYITKIKPAGKKAMRVFDYLNGVNKDKLKGAKVE